ncbi:MAG TPA: NADH-quinone oxidoreductase subunit L [Phnomibacter sp.]|nr:NADH-quinone oxidoreductase subunit L [Phnomibacter sp.]
MTQLAWYIPVLPLIGFLLNGLLRDRLSRPLTSIIGCGTVLGSFLLSIAVFTKMNGQTEVVQLFEFIKVGSLSIPFAFQFDALSSVFLLIITGVGFLIHVYSTAYMHDESPAHFARYFSYLNLFVFSMLLLVMGANYVIMFIGWEGVGLCSYLLIGYWFKNTEYNNAAKKAFIMNRIGDLGVLLAVFWMIQKFGTVTFAGDGGVLAQAASLAVNDPALVGITLLLLVGATGKSAQIPLYTWLPDAMAGPTPVSALIHAATMVTAGIYMIARSNVLYTLAQTTSGIVAIVGLATAILAASIALRQNDIKKVLAYSTVSQLGFMFLALGVGAYVGAVFHVMTHAFFKALLFLGAGSVIHGMHHQQDMRMYGGLKKQMPVTHATMLIGCLAIAGIPGLSGFFSKDEILMGAFAYNPVLYFLGLGAALMTAFYMFRLYAMTFLGEHRSGAHHVPHESPAAMTIPLVVLAGLSIIGGYIGLPELLMHDAHKLNTFLAPVFAQSTELQTAHAISHSTEWMLMGLSTALILVVIVLAIRKYATYQKTDAEDTGFGRLLANKWYVDELYDAVIVKPVYGIGNLFTSVVEKSGIDKTVNGVGKGVQYLSRQFRLLQSGNVGNYVLMMVVAIVGFIWIIYYLKL